VPRVLTHVRSGDGLSRDPADAPARENRLKSRPVPQPSHSGTPSTGDREFLIDHGIVCSVAVQGLATFPWPRQTAFALEDAPTGPAPQGGTGFAVEERAPGAKEDNSMPMKSAKSQEPATPGVSAKSVKPVLPLETPRALAIVIAIMFVTVAAFIMMARQEPTQRAMSNVQPRTATVAQNTARPQTAARTTPTVRRASTSASAAKPTIASKESEPTRVASAQADAITVTGCLEQDDDTFKLKDTEGENAPTSRSWKGGFLRRSNRSVEVVDASNRFKLANHVGERVTATGTLVDGDMQLRSLRRVAASCEEKEV
jgi:hypothetical protein